MFKYRQAFIRNDETRYRAYMDKEANHEAKLHTGTLMPYDVVRPFYTGKMDDAQKKMLDVTWNALEDFTTDEYAIVVVDGSGSMYCHTNPMPITVAHSLGRECCIPLPFLAKIQLDYKWRCAYEFCIRKH